MSGTHKRRKGWFQFGLRSVLAMPVLVACTWWWHAWPQRTAEKFHRFLASGDVESARLMVLGATRPELDQLWSASQKRDSQIVPPRIGPRSLVDWLCSRGEFNVDFDQGASRQCFGRFVASRGLLTPVSPGEADMVVVYTIRNLGADATMAKVRAEFQSDRPARITVDPERGRVLVLAPEGTQKEFQSFLQRVDTDAATRGAARMPGAAP